MTKMSVIDISTSEPTSFRVKDHRKAIPTSVKFEAVMRQDGKCAHCGVKLGAWSDTRFDHRPALQERAWNEEAQDFEPPQNDPNFLDAIHVNCHDVRTNGRGGEKRICTAGSDAGNAGKVRRLTRTEEEFRRKLLAKTDPDAIAPEPRRHKQKIPNRKAAWPSRPFPKRPKAPKTRKGVAER